MTEVSDRHSVTKGWVGAIANTVKAYQEEIASLRAENARLQEQDAGLLSKRRRN